MRDRISVSRAYEHSLTAFRNISSLSVMDSINTDQRLGNLSQYIRSDWNASASTEIHSIISGSDLHVVNHLFDAKTLAAFSRSQPSEGGEASKSKWFEPNQEQSKEILTEHERYVISLQQ